MKKIFLAISMVALFAAGAYAQSISGGLKAGVNISNQKLKLGDESESLDSKIGFHAGGYLTAMISDNFGIQPELLFSAMGAKEDDVNLNFGYISIPVMLRYNVSENINIQAGPQAGFLMSAKAKADGESEDMKDFYNSIDFGVAVGLGADFGKVNAGARYYAGLSNIAGDEFSDEFGDDFSWKNSAIQIFLGVKLFGE
jgi:hypothetical protein